MRIQTVLRQCVLISGSRHEGKSFGKVNASQQRAGSGFRPDQLQSRLGIHVDVVVTHYFAKDFKIADDHVAQ